MATVDGVVTNPDANGVVQGNGDGGVDKMAGGTGNDRLQGHAEFNQYYGGAGSDTFILNAKYASDGDTAAASTAFDNQSSYITDFQGAGGWSASNNDFIAFTGFGAGATLNATGTGTSGTSGATIYYYTIDYTVDGVDHHYNFMINSLNSKALGAGDYGFY